MASGFHLAFFLCLTAGLWISETESTKKYYGGCPWGWTRVGSRCFRVQTSRRTMADAELYCIALGGNLASIRSSWEHHYIRYLIYRRYRSYPTTWIGYFDAIQEGRWMWTDGSKGRFTRWGRGEPNNIRGEHCAEINFRRFYWNDVPCRFKKPFVCARKL